MTTAKKPARKAVSMVDEDRAFFESAYKNDPKARAAMDAEGRAPGAKKPAAKTPAKKVGKK